MKSLKVKLGIFSLLTILTVSVFMTSCEQDTIEMAGTEYQDFEVKESYTIYAPENDFSLNELINLETSNARQNFVDDLNSKYEPETEVEVESRQHCTSWSSWYKSYPCERVRWRTCFNSRDAVTKYQFKCVCNDGLACTSSSLSPPCIIC